MPFNPNNDLTDDEVLDHGTKGQEPLMGNDSPAGFYTGKLLAAAGREYCNVTRWIKDNTPWIATVVMEFTDENSSVLVRLRRQSDGVVVRTFGPRVVTGGARRTSNFADRHEFIGTVAVYKVAKKIEARLIADGVLQQPGG